MGLQGTYTAIVTPMVGRGEVDETAFRELLSWQSGSGIDGVIVGGTTGESPTLSEDELERLFRLAAETIGSSRVVAAAGRNNLAETRRLVRVAHDLGIPSVLLVDPYYNGPSSLEIRREGLAPIAREFPSVGLVPYVIPSRTGTRLEPRDVAHLLDDGVRIDGLKDATGDPAYARSLRARAPSLPILSGDDGRTVSMIADPDVRAAGVISVVSNLLPGPIRSMVAHGLSGDLAAARSLERTLRPLLDSVTMVVRETAPNGDAIEVRSRNPVPIKTALALLGVPVGSCRPPLGRLTPLGMQRLLAALRRVGDAVPGIYAPIADRFGVDPLGRIEDPGIAREFQYASA